MKLTLCFCKKTDYWTRFTQRIIRTHKGKDVYTPFVGWKEKRGTSWFFSYFDPTTPQLLKYNTSRRPTPVSVPYIQQYIFRGDLVECMVGKDKGKQGIVAHVAKERNAVFVENLNAEMVSTPGMKMLSILRPLEMPQEVKLVDPGDKSPTDIEWRYTEQGRLVRVTLNTGRIIPIPLAESKTTDGDLINTGTYKSKSPQHRWEILERTLKRPTIDDAAYWRHPGGKLPGNIDKDTDEKEVIKVTFKPKLKSFEEDIMDQMGIKEDRKYQKTYWY